MPDQFRRAMHRLRVATVTEQMRAIQAQEQPTNPAAAAEAADAPGGSFLRDGELALDRGARKPSLTVEAMRSLFGQRD